MGTFSTKLRVWNPAKPKRVEELEVVVDTGAAYSWVSRSRLQSLGVTPVRGMQFRTIEGHLIERDLAPYFWQQTDLPEATTWLSRKPEIWK